MDLLPWCLVVGVATYILVPKNREEGFASEKKVVTVVSKEQTHPAHGKGGNAGYLVDGKPVISLRRGQTYVFDQGHASNHTHEVHVATTWKGGAHKKDAYKPGSQTYEGEAGFPGAQLVFRVPKDAPSKGLYLACAHHGFMGFPIQITD
jgi:hypothetical protein